VQAGVAAAGGKRPETSTGFHALTRILLFIKHRLPFIWNWIDWLNETLFRVLHGTKLSVEAERCFEEFTLEGFVFRTLKEADISPLSELLLSQDPARVEHFNPHGFDTDSLESVYRNRSFLMFGVFEHEKLAGYFFLRCFWNGRCFVGRLIDEPFERRGIGRVMNQILYHTAWRSGFRCHTTISKDNALVMRSHANNPNVKVLGELANGYQFIEFIPPSGGNRLTFVRGIIKRGFDLAAAAAGLVLTFWIIGIAWLLAKFDTGDTGFFRQVRVGRYGRHFRTLKIRTMRHSNTFTTNVTTAEDPRITRLGRFWRRTKIDELPQLINVLFGQMSFVGPRPDVPGFADRLTGADRIILSIRPGITGPATLEYRDEEALLASVDDPEAYNRDVIFPDKVRLNREYMANWSFWKDIRYILATIFG
jgi:lipopolysaccharide/colanic/teichoic acid biosynthesis glycosyltransferase